MKKIVSLIFIFILTISLIGCSKNNDFEIAGTYDVTFNFRDEIIKNWNESMKTITDISIEDYIGDVNLIITSEFSKNGIYKIYLDEEKFNILINETKQICENIWNDFIDECIIEILAENGIIIEDIESFEKTFGMTREDMIKKIYGVDIETMSDYFASNYDPIVLYMDTFILEGKYKTKDGKLYLSNSLDTEIDETFFAIYCFEGNDILITEVSDFEINSVEERL